MTGVIGLEQSYYKACHGAVLRNNSVGNRFRRSKQIFERVAAVGFAINKATLIQTPTLVDLDQRCFVDGEAYSRDTFEYLLTAPESVSYRVVTQNSAMAGFVIGLLEPDHTGHITTIGIAPEHRRRRLASSLMDRVEEGFRRRDPRS